MMTNKPTKITQSDLKFYPSERLTDHDDGGGLALGTAIKGVANELFAPISGIDRVNGAFSMRKIFAGLQRDDDEALIGAHVAITKPPADPQVSYLLFRADKFGELRGDGVKRIEAFSVATIESTMTLLSNPTKGSKIIQAYQRLSDTPPQVGDVYCLRQEKVGFEALEQYVRLVRVDSKTRVFNESDRSFERRVVKMEISQSLIYDFIGVDYPSTTYALSPTKIRETHVADAGQYYGVKPLIAPAQAGSGSIQVKSLMEKLVPTATVEHAMTDLLATQRTPLLFDAANDSISFGVYANLRQIQTYQLPAFLPGSLDLLGVIRDKDGKLLYEDEEIGTIDYAKGLINQTKMVEFAGSGHVSFKPAVVSYPLSDSLSIKVDINNRSYNYAITLLNVGIGSVAISYLSQGKWYELNDNGQGRLLGVSDNHGSGTINYKTGALTLTCGQLPDVDSSIIITWGNQKQLNRKNTNPVRPHVCYTLSQDALLNTIAITTADGKRAQVGNDGRLTGQLTGDYDKKNRTLRVDVDNLSQSQSAVTISYNLGVKSSKSFEGQSGHGDNITLKLSDSALTVGLTEVKLGVDVYTAPKTVGSGGIVGSGGGGKKIDKAVVQLFEDGNGNLSDGSGQVIGTVNHSAGTVRIKRQFQLTLIRPKLSLLSQTQPFAPKIFDGLSSEMFEAVYDGGVIHTSFMDTQTGKAQSENFDERPLVIDLGVMAGETVVSGSLIFQMAEQTYLDDQGTLYTQMSVNNKGRAVGSVDYISGIVTLKQWTAHTITLISLATSFDKLVVEQLSFRTPTTPIRPSSLQILATASDGTLINATANAQGIIKGAYIDGAVDVKSGVVTVRFGEWVDKDLVQDEDWFHPDLVVGDKAWQALAVLADSIHFNAVAISHLPINSEHINIDTVRLPQDGRIPIFRRGDTILIGNRQTTDIGSAFTSGQTVNLPRDNLDRICMMDANDKPVLANLWDYDLEAGSITFATPLDLSGYAMPLKVMHAREEKNVVLNVDIDGTLTLRFALRHSYEADNSFVSSVLIAGNLAVRASVPFTQSNWDNVWRDEAYGSSLLNRLNVKDYPIVLTDDGAITERWLIKFRSANQFELYGENLGFVMRTDTLQNLAPINPATQKPYFTIDKRAFGNDAPWAAQDVIRFNTWGTLAPLWLVRAVQPSGAKEHKEDGFRVCLFGDTTEV